MRKILLIEDEEIVSSILEMFLQKLGYNLIGVAKDDRDAISLCNKEIPDVVVIDANINGSMNGVELAKIIETNWQLPIIFLTNDIKEQTTQRAKLSNSHLYLTNPIEKKELGFSIELAYYKNKSKLGIK
ncbi:MAG: response regulator [Marinifilaceae bacterium]|jgi:CheY-like chemotaxis protein|nr:response regulator [Marinifilaceae bacterium]